MKNCPKYLKNLTPIHISLFLKTVQIFSESQLIFSHHCMIDQPLQHTKLPKTLILQTYLPHGDRFSSQILIHNHHLHPCSSQHVLIMNIIIKSTRACWTGWQTTLALVRWSSSSSPRQMSSSTFSSSSAPAVGQGWIWFSNLILI